MRSKLRGCAVELGNKSDVCGFGGRDAAYEESVRADRELERARQAERERAALEAARAAEAQQRRAEQRAALQVAEPAQGATIRFRMPWGATVQRKFEVRAVCVRVGAAHCACTPAR